MEFKNIRVGSTYKINDVNPSGHFFYIGTYVKVNKIKDHSVHVESVTGEKGNLAAYHLDELNSSEKHFLSRNYGTTTI